MAAESEQDTTCRELDISSEQCGSETDSELIQVVQLNSGAQIDLTDEDAAGDSDDSGGPTTQPYDPRPGEDGARRRIAYALIGILGIVIFSSMALFLIPCVDKGALKEVLGMILSPLFTLVSAATAFYYAAKK